ncbi:hypothetical protein TRVL_04124 [Trypanosoma vivax]|nr:hypothetical protein TRVL_04124 [Trypanosoma vivax]
MASFKRPLLVLLLALGLLSCGALCVESPSGDNSSQISNETGEGTDGANSPIGTGDDLSNTGGQAEDENELFKNGGTWYLGGDKERKKKPAPPTDEIDKTKESAGKANKETAATLSTLIFAAGYLSNR